MNIPFQPQQPIFTKVGGISELIHMSAEERSRYNISLDSYRTNLSAMKNERAEGRAEGIEEGRAEGIAKGRAEGIVKCRAEGILSTAIKLKSMGMDIAFISQATGQSEEEINGLQGLVPTSHNWQPDSITQAADAHEAIKYMWAKFYWISVCYLFW